MFPPSKSSSSPPRKQIQKLLIFLHCGIPTGWSHNAEILNSFWIGWGIPQCRKTKYFVFLEGLRMICYVETCRTDKYTSVYKNKCCVIDGSSKGATWSHPGAIPPGPKFKNRGVQILSPPKIGGKSPRKNIVRQNLTFEGLCVEPPKMGGKSPWQDIT
jgi:hypothetical protein